MKGPTVLASNVGSSSLKLALYADPDAAGWQLQQSASFSGTPAKLTKSLAAWLDDHPAPGAVLHRVVHAGAVTEQAEPIDAALLERIQHWLPLAPDHNARALEHIALIADLYPACMQFAVYDSGLFAGLPAEATRFALPDELSERWPIRRYGFHGLAHRNQWRQVEQLAGEERRSCRRVLTLQLGSGCSVTAWLNGEVADTSMGFTPLGGLTMARRAGDLDPGIMLHLLKNERWRVSRVERLLLQNAGLAALGGHDGHFSAILKEAQEGEGDNSAAEAIRHYCYQLCKTVGGFMTVLGGLDAISFGGGVGENSPLVRGAVATGLAFMGVKLNPAANNHAQVAEGSAKPVALHAADSTVAVYLTPVNEMDEMIRQYEVLSK